MISQYSNALKSESFYEFTILPLAINRKVLTVEIAFTMWIVFMELAWIKLSVW